MMLPADIQANEGINSLVSRIGDRCKSITQGVLDARVKLKHALNVGCRDTPEKWSLRRARAQTILEACSSSLADVQTVMQEAGRFAPPPPSQDRRCESEIPPIHCPHSHILEFLELCVCKVQYRNTGGGGSVSAANTMVSRHHVVNLCFPSEGLATLQPAERRRCSS